ncbi:MAG: trimethylamine methyltransferase family protein [Clostridiales Family XIII bacterium]|jgi:trimethylamine--corrinoid protein Co-methyltransferase|nr:trimethylamine methyltransferase family protein [Clostridiales Family XIII bacterium]
MNPFTANPLNQLSVLSLEDVKKIHEASLRILSEAGVLVESDEAVHLFETAGATAEKRADGYLVKLPPALIESCIESAPKDIVWYGRVPGRDYDSSKGNVAFSTFGECVKIIDPATKEVRATRKEDVAGITKVCDFFDEIAVVERACGSLDLPAAVQPAHNFDAMVRSTSKAIFLAAVNRENAETIVEMAQAVAGGEGKLRERPFLNFFVCPVSPLILGQGCCDVAITAARAGVGVATIPMSLSGATSVATLAGVVAQHNAEVLATLALTQLAAKGTRFFYCSMTTIMDLKYMIPATGAPEHSLIGGAVVKMAQHYGLPSWIGGGVSDSKLPDAQAGYEYALGALFGALSGASITYGAGALESCLLIDYAKLVMDCESLGFIRRLLAGIAVDDETLALDLILRKGPKVDFIMEDHTLDHMHEQTPVRAFSRIPRDSWAQKGALPADEAAYLRAAEILKTHEVEPLPDGVAGKLDSILASRLK